MPEKLPHVRFLRSVLRRWAARRRGINRQQPDPLLPLICDLDEVKPPLGLMARIEDEIAGLEPVAGQGACDYRITAVLRTHGLSFLLGILAGAVLTIAIFLATVHPLLDPLPFLPA